jgi:site-specific DNA recombinase
VESKHEKLVSKEIFFKANQEKAKIPHGYKANPLNDNLPLKQFARCENCGENLRGYLVKKKGLYYYKCDNGSKCSCNVSARKLHNIFESILEEITLHDDYKEVFQLQLKKLFQAINDEREKNALSYRIRIKDLEEKIEKLEERFINDEIKSDLYLKFSVRYNHEKEEMLNNLNNLRYTTSNLDAYIKNATNYVGKLASTWSSSDYTEKEDYKKPFSRKDSIIIRKQMRLEPQN